MDLVFFYFFEISLVVGALFVCLFAGWKWGPATALQEMRLAAPQTWMGPLWSVLVRYVCPVAILLIIIFTVRSLVA